MKFGFAFCLALAGTLLVSCNMNTDKRKSFSDVTEYNDYVVDQIEGINSVYTYTLDTSITIKAALQACDSLVTLCEKTTANLKGIQPYEGDSSLTMQTLEYIHFMKVNGEKHIKDFLKLEDKFLKLDFTDEEALFDEIGRTMNELNTSQEREIEKVNAVQQKFAKKHHMIIMG